MKKLFIWERLFFSVICEDIFFYFLENKKIGTLSNLFKYIVVYILKYLIILWKRSSNVMYKQS